MNLVAVPTNAACDNFRYACESMIVLRAYNDTNCLHLQTHHNNHGENP